MTATSRLRRVPTVQRASRNGRPTGPLAERARRGDRAAFAELHAAYLGAVHAVVLARVEPELAEDLVQDVFLAAWEKLPALRRPASFGPWLLEIARNRVRDHGRRRRPVVPLPDGLSRPRVPKAEAREALRLIQSLGPIYSEPLVMRLVEGMTGPEIAERTGMTTGR